MSRSLAGLIENISTDTQHQAQSATGVASKMQDILRVTEQATAGTQRTAEAVGELALAGDRTQGFGCRLQGRLITRPERRTRMNAATGLTSAH